MSEKPHDGGRAFPLASTEINQHGVEFPNLEGGMSLRDWFAGHALVGLLDPRWDANAVNQAHVTASEAYRIADFMIAERAKKETK